MSKISIIQLNNTSLLSKYSDVSAAIDKIKIIGMTATNLIPKFSESIETEKYNK
ncbi:hypothetical protein [Paucilactobacillus hokkaidonensis]|uniref:hypothetical protein n=1 Tax=Paucilactobacillus hokkaidonensis TaxID=1193095 RepID=UPI002091FAC1|nr:hypothetical protein [Paucilactobacillus hokkaidonensis]